MTNHGEPAMLFEFGGPQPINQHAYPRYAWFRLRGRASEWLPATPTGAIEA